MGAERGSHAALRGMILANSAWLPYAPWHRVAYLSPADNAHGSLLGRLRGVHQPVVKPRNRFAAARLPLLAGL